MYEACFQLALADIVCAGSTKQARLSEQQPKAMILVEIIIKPLLQIA